VECDEKLQTVYHQLLQAGHERQETEKEAKMKETLANLQRLFPGKNNHLALFRILAYKLFQVSVAASST